jgi:hypothetical protein
MTWKVTRQRDEAIIARNFPTQRAAQDYKESIEETYTVTEE